MCRPILPIDPATMLALPSSRPTTAELFTRALAGDFLGDVTPSADLGYLAVEATDAAIEQWEAANDMHPHTATVTPAVTDTVRRMLVRYASDRMMDAADAANDARADAIESGDVDGDGNPIPYAPYRAV